MYSVRKECGRILARETFVEADIVSTVPESASAAGLGYAEEVKLFPWNHGSCYSTLEHFFLDLFSWKVFLRMLQLFWSLSCHYGAI